MPIPELNEVFVERRSLPTDEPPDRTNAYRVTNRLPGSTYLVRGVPVDRPALGRDDRVKIDMEPEDALRALLSSKRHPAK